MDQYGATACVAPPSSDYDQSDEGKYIGAFKNGISPYVRKQSPNFDFSSQAYHIQMSYTLKDRGIAIGVITLGIEEQFVP